MESPSQVCPLRHFRLLSLIFKKDLKSHLYKCRHLPEGYSCRIEDYRFQERAVDNALF